MPSRYEWLVLVHVLAVVLWVGGSAVLQALVLRARARRDTASIARLWGDIEWMGSRVFPPTTLVVLGAGIGAVLEGPWSFGDGWVTAGLVVFALSFVAGAGFLGPESGRIRALAAERGADAPEVAARIARVMVVTRVELVLLAAVIAVMVVKPGA